MDDLKEMARLHSAGAIIRHVSLFDNLATHKNDHHLPPDFIKKWAVPFYPKIASSDDLGWVDQIKEIAPDITKDICLELLGDFNWRTRLVGSYFAAVKGYRELIEVIGTHLLKSEVCCVGHIYSLTLTFFNEKNCVEYLNRYLDYYLTKPFLYFDQKRVLEAVLLLDRENGTDYFTKHIEKWELLQAERSRIQKSQAEEVVKSLEQKGPVNTTEVLQSLQTGGREADEFSTDFFDRQILILRELNQNNG